MAAYQAYVEWPALKRTAKSANVLIEAISKRRAPHLGGLRCWQNRDAIPGIESALNQGLRVCIATPRTDVVLELAPRLKAPFRVLTFQRFMEEARTKGGYLRL